VRSRRRARRRTARRVACHRAYAACAELTGPLAVSALPDRPVTYRRLLSRDDRAVLVALMLCGCVTAMVFLGWLMLPQHVPGGNRVGWGGWHLFAARATFCLMVAVELIRIAQNACVFVFAWHAHDPVPVAAPPGLRIALVTTIVPTREPIEIVTRSLRALRGVEYAGQVDVWILDEGDDPAVRRVADELGVHHFTRRGRPGYNQPDGPFKAGTKAGNHNAWRAEHEHRYDVVGVFDPDHVVRPMFLQRTLGYFRDPDVAFVVTPQVYGNMYDGFLPHGAAGQQWLFNAIIERAGNGLGGPMLTGTNNLYRPAALAGVGGFRSSVVEDHLTSIHVHASANPATGNRWRSVYTPDVLAIGEGPSTWTDYLNQQRRWAYGNNEIVTRREVWPDGRLPLRQRLFYCLLQFYYPSVAASWVMGNAAVATYLLIGGTGVNIAPAQWLPLWGASVGSCFALLVWLRRFYLAGHERREWGLPAYLLSVFAGPTYTAAATAALLRRPSTFTVTAKGNLRSADSLHTFRLNLRWGLLMAAVLAASYALGHDRLVNGGWALITVAAGLLPLVIAGLARGRAAAPVPAPVPAPRDGGHDGTTACSAPAGSALANQERDREPRRLPHPLDDVPAPDGRFVGVAQVVQRVGVNPDPNQPDPRPVVQA
jgi:cellulose synthase (UDP-forming)